MRVLVLAVAIVIGLWLFKRSQSPAPLSVDFYTPPEAGGGGLRAMMDAIGNFEKSGFGRNNPGNIKAIAGKTYPGQVGVDANGFAVFDSVDSGFGKLGDLISTRAARNPSWDFYDFFNYYLRGSTTAPSVDRQGNSDSYAEYVAGALGVDPTASVADAIGIGGFNG